MSDLLTDILSQETIYHLEMLIPLFLQLIGMVFAVFADSYISKKHKRVLLIIAILALVLIFQNYTENLLAAGEAKVLARTLTSICGYSVRPVIIVLFLYVINPEGQTIPA